MIEANRQCLRQALALLEVLTDSQYADPRGDWSPVGAQYRHIVEHYQCLLEGVEAGRVDYDARSRNATLEVSRDYAREVTAELLVALESLVGRAADQPLQVQIQCRADDPTPCWAASTLGRELQFLVSHSVHHFALVKLLVASDRVPLDEDFGLAPSTMSHGRTIR